MGKAAPVNGRPARRLIPWDKYFTSRKDKSACDLFYTGSIRQSGRYTVSDFFHFLRRVDPDIRIEHRKGSTVSITRVVGYVGRLPVEKTTSLHIPHRPGKSAQDIYPQLKLELQKRLQILGIFTG